MCPEKIRDVKVPVSNRLKRKQKKEAKRFRIIRPIVGQSRVALKGENITKQRPTKTDQSPTTLSKEEENDS